MTKLFFCKRESLFGLTVHCFHFSPEQLYVQNDPNLGLLYLFDAIFSNTVPDNPKLSITDQNGPNCPNSSKIKIYQVGHGLDPSQDFSGLFQNFLITCFSFFCYLSAVWLTSHPVQWHPSPTLDGSLNDHIFPHLKWWQASEAEKSHKTLLRTNKLD